MALDVLSTTQTQKIDDSVSPSENFSHVADEYRVDSSTGNVTAASEGDGQDDGFNLGAPVDDTALLQLINAWLMINPVPSGNEVVSFIMSLGFDFEHDSEAFNNMIDIVTDMITGEGQDLSDSAPESESDDTAFPIFDPADGLTFEDSDFGDDEDEEDLEHETDGEGFFIESAADDTNTPEPRDTDTTEDNPSLELGAAEPDALADGLNNDGTTVTGEDPEAEALRNDGKPVQDADQS
jgi:hypothetical protein